MIQTITSQRPFETNRDAESPNRNLTPITTELDDTDRLVVGGCRLSDLAERYGTPLYVLDEACLLYTSPSPRDRQKSRMPSSA